MKRLDLVIAKSRSSRDLVSLRALDGTVPSLQELLTEAGFREGDRVAIVPADEVTGDVTVEKGEFDFVAIAHGISICGQGATEIAALDSLIACLNAYVDAYRRRYEALPSDPTGGGEAGR